VSIDTSPKRMILVATNSGKQILRGVNRAYSLNLLEGGQTLRASLSLLRSQGMIDDADYREPVSCLSTSLAMVEAAYMGRHVGEDEWQL
jgi:hypothetical protein